MLASFIPSLYLYSTPPPAPLPIWKPERSKNIEERPGQDFKSWALTVYIWFLNRALDHHWTQWTAPSRLGDKVYPGQLPSFLGNSLGSESWVDVHGQPSTGYIIFGATLGHHAESCYPSYVIWRPSLYYLHYRWLYTTCTLISKH